MTSTTDDHGHEAAATVTDRVHDTSWSANLEKPRHAEDQDRVVAEAIEAVEHTEPGNHVNLVSHGNHGHPEDYLFDALDAASVEDGPLADRDLEWEHVEQCGCGGHVTRVHVA